MTTRIGIIGVGGFGVFCLEQYRKLPDVRVTAIADINAARLAQVAADYDIPVTTSDWRALATHSEVDVVYIATPPFLHAEQALAALQAGKHVFCDKPLALTTADADALLAASAQHGGRLGINFVMRYTRVYTLIHDLLRSGALGEPLYCSFLNAAGDLPAGHWFWDPALSGGIPIEHGVHFFDIFGAFFGPGVVRCAAVDRRADGAEDQWSIGVDYAKVHGQFYHGFVKASVLEHTWAVIECARGHLILQDWLPTRLDFDCLTDLDGVTAITKLVPEVHVEPAEGPVLAHGQTAAVTHQVQAAVVAGEKQVLYAQAVRDAMADFLAWTRDPAHTPRVTGRDARDAVAMAEAAVELAHRTG